MVFDFKTYSNCIIILICLCSHLANVGHRPGRRKEPWKSLLPERDREMAQGAAVVNDEEAIGKAEWRDAGIHA